MKKEREKKIRKIFDKLFTKLIDEIIAKTFISEDNWDRVDVSSLLEPEINTKEKK